MKLSALPELIFPPRCIHCKRDIDKGAICDACFRSIPLYTAFFCGRCGNRLPELKKTCHPSLRYLLGAAGDYGNETLRDLIHGLKFNGVRDAATPLAELLVAYLENTDLGTQNFIVMPIPLHVSRMRERGFNQSELIAKSFASRLHLPFETQGFLRQKKTAAQSELSDYDLRKENMRNAFFAKEPSPAKGKNIILIDDVATSCATFSEAADALKAVGAKKIVALAAARA